VDAVDQRMLVVLVDMPASVYTVRICFFKDEGVPEHLDRGMLKSGEMHAVSNASKQEMTHGRSRLPPNLTRAKHENFQCIHVCIVIATPPSVITVLFLLTLFPIQFFFL
jgi:hypothetical protein